jgi:hypothetical protein
VDQLRDESLEKKGIRRDEDERGKLRMHTWKNRAQPIPSISMIEGMTSSVALTTSGLSNMYVQTVVIIPLPKREHRPSNLALVPSGADNSKSRSDCDLERRSMVGANGDSWCARVLVNDWKLAQKVGR